MNIAVHMFRKAEVDYSDFVLMFPEGRSYVREPKREYRVRQMHPVR
jgi:hypothetical protein